MRTALKTQNRLPYQGVLTVANLITDDMRLAGVQGDGEAWPFGGAGVWPAATNKVTQSIPGALATTGVTKAGDAAATLTKVADSTHPFPASTADVWCLDNSAGAGDATVEFDGGASAAAHTGSIWAYAGAGTPTLSIEGASAVNITGSVWADFSCTATANLNDNLRVTCPAGAVAYFVAAQLETGSIRTPLVVTDGGTASRSAGSAYIPNTPTLLDETAGWAAVRVKTGWGNSNEPTSGRVLSWRDDGSNFMALFYEQAGNAWKFERAATSSQAVTVADTVAIGDTFTLISAWDASKLYLSVDGSAYTEVAGTAYIPALTGNMHFGQSGVGTAYGYNTFFWGVFGSGSKPDPTVVHSWGNNNPLPHMLPAATLPKALAHFEGDGRAYRRASH